MMANSGSWGDPKWAELIEESIEFKTAWYNAVSEYDYVYVDGWRPEYETYGLSDIEREDLGF